MLYNSDHPFRLLHSLSVTLGIATAPANAETIHVTSTDQKISSTGGCSLQGGIYSSNLLTNQAVGSRIAWHGQLNVNPELFHDMGSPHETEYKGENVHVNSQ